MNPLDFVDSQRGKLTCPRQYSDRKEDGWMDRLI